MSQQVCSKQKDKNWQMSFRKEIFCIFLIRIQDNRKVNVLTAKGSFNNYIDGFFYLFDQPTNHLDKQKESISLAGIDIFLTIQQPLPVYAVFE